MEPLKVVIVGDGLVGKTSLLLTYIRNKFPDDWVPRCIDATPHNVTVNDKSLSLLLWDTSGGDDYPRIRPLEYPGTNVFLVCFSLVDKESFENVLNVYHQEICRHYPKVPVILVGTKLDLRNDWKIEDKLEKVNVKPISTEEGLQMRERIAAAKYIECSSLAGIGVQEIFKEVVQVGSQSVLHAKNKPKCFLSCTLTDCFCLCNCIFY